ncbi:30S ribosomal protein S9 [Candidatus Jorgensenbacteria bacterium]|nr:30S ribosomal protein S9 [Candidatus Jorgensenbacteria bacterium]
MIHKSSHAEKNIHHKKTTPLKKDRYFEAVGRRKTAVARVRLFPAKDASGPIDVFVNDKQLSGYFPLKKMQDIVRAPFEALTLKEYKVTAQVKGGGVNAQAEAIRLGIARTLVVLNSIWRSRLKALGYLRRDPRMVERKKYGLRKARRPQQWRKR